MGFYWANGCHVHAKSVNRHVYIAFDIVYILMVEHQQLIETSRTRGVLNKREREYLLGKSDIEPRTQEERAVRATIRKHIHNAFLDFYIIFEELQERDMDQIFNEQKEGADAFYPGVIHTLAFLYRGTRGNQSHPFESLLQSGVWTGVPEPTQEAFLNVAVTFDVDHAEPVNVETIADKLEWLNWHELTSEEMKFVFHVSRKADVSLKELIDPSLFLAAVEELEQQGEIESVAIDPSE